MASEEQQNSGRILPIATSCYWRSPASFTAGLWIVLTMALAAGSVAGTMCRGPLSGRSSSRWPV
jgi:hypothetical protein